MKQSRFTGLLFCIATAFCLASCGGGSNEKKATADSTAVDTVAKAPVAPPAVNTIITAPMNMAIVIHKITNYGKWLPAYEGHDSMRQANGLHSYVVARGLRDSNMVMVALKVDDVSKAKAAFKDPAMKARMQKSGVVGPPMVSFVTATWQDTAKIETTLRSQTTFMVKDWDAWQKTFEEGKKERLDNGITDRVIGHDVDDNKKVALVTAVLDTTKAFAYYKSDALKKRRAAGGVIGEPKRFLFKIVKRY